MRNLTQSLLKQLLHYDPEIGIWTWLAPYSRNIKPGDMAGSISGRYRRIQIDGSHYQSGRLIWFYMTGEWPNNLIDHWNRDSHDDRWKNLRQATHSQSNFNRYDGVRGVYAAGNKWRAQVGPDRDLGIFATFEEALMARDEAAQRIGGEFAILNRDLLSA